MSYFKELQNLYDPEVIVNDGLIDVKELLSDDEYYNNVYTTIYNTLLDNYSNKLCLYGLEVDGEPFVMYANTLITHMILWQPFLDFKNVEFLPEDFIINTKNISADTIADYLDILIAHFIQTVNQDDLNESISDVIERLGWISLDFNPLVGNTINLYDKIKLSERNPQYDDLVHTKLDDENMSMDEIEDEMNRRTTLLYEILSTEDNTFKDYVNSKEGLNRDQICQFEIVIGPKPDVRGNVFPKIVNTNFICGGMQSASDYYIDASGGRKASIINYSQVKVSGYMTRKLSLLCMNTLLNPENDDCGSKNYVQVNIENKKILGRLNGRWANDGLGNEFLIRKTDTDLIGKTVNLRSPITCCGHDGKICRKCYGELSKINDNIHVGILGCQFLTEQQTQKMLSAKHLLKTNSEKINWSEEFLELFNVSANSISLNPTLASVKAYSLVFHEDDINESGDSEFANL